jgi:hypothetical protein
MSKIRLLALAMIGLAMGVTRVHAENISAKKIFIKDNADASKRQVQVLSVDGAVHFSDAVDPAANGASLHLYSTTDDFCATLPAGPDWVSKKGKVWKYKNKATKSSAQLKDGKLLVSIKSGVTYTLQDDGTQAAVNAQVQFGGGTRFCMRCTGNKKNTATKFLGKECAAAACDAEPSSCPASGTTSTSTTGVAATTTSSTMPAAGVVLKGALTATAGRFNYNLTLGLPGANAACDTHFAGTHACTSAELQNAEGAGDLAGLKDFSNNTVTSFWAIDPNAAPLEQCQDDAVGGSGLNWEYGTAHTASRGSKIALTNATGALGALTTDLQCNLSGNSWVGCCQ